MTDPVPEMKVHYDAASDRLLFTIGDAVCAFDAAGVDKLLAGLGEARSNMKPEYTADITGEQMNVVSNPTWRTMGIALAPEPLLHIRDPRFGWLHYALAIDSAKRLGLSLVDLADKAAPASTGTKQ